MEIHPFKCGSFAKEVKKGNDEGVQKRRECCPTDLG